MEIEGPLRVPLRVGDRRADLRPCRDRGARRPQLLERRDSPILAQQGPYRSRAIEDRARTDSIEAANDDAAEAGRFFDT